MSDQVIHAKELNAQHLTRDIIYKLKMQTSAALTGASLDNP